MTPDARRMLDAHVQFELGRWAPPQRDASLRRQVQAVTGWLRTCRVRDLLPPDVPARVAAAVDGLPVTDELVGMVADVAATARDSLASSDLTWGDLAAEDHVIAVADLVADWEEPRRRAISAVTGSEAYTRLVAHVLYHGLKAYLLTENVVARRVPGASSLVRLGQRGLSAAVPALEANVDRQLTAFVQANISDTLRESERFLDRTLDRETLAAMAGEAWDAVRDKPLASLADPVGEADLEALVVTVAPLARSVLASGLPSAVAEHAVSRLLDVHGDRLVGDVLDDLAVETAALEDGLAAWLAPVVAHAHDSGFLEAQIRAHLAPFYEALPTLLTSSD